MLAYFDMYFDMADLSAMRLILVCKSCGCLVDIQYRQTHMSKCLPA